MIINEPLTDAIDSINEDAETRYESLRYDIERPIPRQGNYCSILELRAHEPTPAYRYRSRNRARGANIRTGHFLTRCR